MSNDRNGWDHGDLDQTVAWDDMTTEELQAEIEELTEAIAHIKGQLDRAAAELAETGVYADRKWYVSAKYALRMKGAKHQRLLRYTADRKRQERKTKSQRFEQCFLASCRRRLNPELFAELMQEAREECVND